MSKESCSTWGRVHLVAGRAWCITGVGQCNGMMGRRAERVRGIGYCLVDCLHLNGWNVRLACLIATFWKLLAAGTMHSVGPWVAQPPSYRPSRHMKVQYILRSLVIPAGIVPCVLERKRLWASQGPKWWRRAG